MAAASVYGHLPGQVTCDAGLTTCATGHDGLCHVIAIAKTVDVEASTLVRFSLPYLVNASSLHFSFNLRLESIDLPLLSRISAASYGLLVFNHPVLTNVAVPALATLDARFTALYIGQNFALPSLSFPSLVSVQAYGRGVYLFNNAALQSLQFPSLLSVDAGLHGLFLWANPALKGVEFPR
jgi:hypothetical protein